MKRPLAWVTVVVAGMFSFSFGVGAQTWPARPITIVVPFPPGPLDVVARLVASKMSDALGQPVVIDNRAGANGTIGSLSVARAAPDGYTILSATVGTHVTSVHLTRKPALRSGWFGFLGPPGLVSEVVMRLNHEIVKGLNAPDARPKLEELGYSIIGNSPADFAALIRDSIERYGAIIKSAGIQPE